MKSDEQSLGSSELPQSQRRARITSRVKTDAVLRVFSGEAVETLSQELGVGVNRIERWKVRFIDAGSAELAKRKDGSSSSRVARYFGSIRQWFWLVLAMVAIVSVLVILMQRSA